MRVPLGSLRWRSRLNLTASALRSVPSWNLMPLRRVNTYTLGCGFSVFSTRLPTTLLFASTLKRLSHTRPMIALLYTSCDLVGSNVVGSRSMATTSWPPLTGLPAADCAAWVGCAAGAGAVVGLAAAAAGWVAFAAGAVVGWAAAAAGWVGLAAGALVAPGAPLGPHPAAPRPPGGMSGRRNQVREIIASSFPVSESAIWGRARLAR